MLLHKLFCLTEPDLADILVRPGFNHVDIKCLTEYTRTHTSTNCSSAFLLPKINRGVRLLVTVD